MIPDSSDIARLLKEKDDAYAERDKCVALIARLALYCGFSAGIGRHSAEDKSWDPEWMNIVFIDLPSGQVSWHIHDNELPLFAGLPSYYEKWDGHTTPEKYLRVISPGLSSSAAEIEHARLATTVAPLTMTAELEAARREDAENEHDTRLLRVFAEVDATRAALALAQAAAYNPRICECINEHDGTICTMPPAHEPPHRGYSPAPHGGHRTSWWDEPASDGKRPA